MAHGGFKDVLKNGGFLAFLWTQFLGAFNDNAYRIIVSLRAVYIVAQAGQSGKYVALAGSIKGFQEIVDGKHDEVPEQAFYMQGTIEEVLEKAEALEKAS